ncbi:7810_t:CDS:10 [Entrophospora sp. SA101]|nr:7810_t:CDS:10 [Entrophospora sp. SA101]
MTNILWEDVLENYGKLLKEEDSCDVIITSILDCLTAANELILPKLAGFIESYLVKKHSSWIKEHPIETLTIAFQNDDWKSLQEFCILAICKQPWMLFESTKFYQLDESILLQIIKRDELQMKESEIWHNIVIWGTMQDSNLPDGMENWKQRDFDSLERILHNFIPFIRFFHMTTKEFDNKVSPYRPIFPNELYEDILWHFIKPDRPKKNPIPPKRHHPYSRDKMPDFAKITAYKTASSKYDIVNTTRDTNTSHVSVIKSIADLFNFKSRTNVIVREVDPELVEAEYVEFTFRDQYIGRSDMWRLRLSLNDTCVYVGKRIEFAGCIRAQIKRIFVKGEQVSCGYVTDNTKPIFRSESAKLFIFVQMSREMWEFDDDGELFFEKAVDGFFTELFHNWKLLGTNHVISISRYCKDFYKVIVDWETKSDWSTTLVSLKEELLRYQRNILLREKHCSDGGNYQILLGKNSYAFEGNILEAINLALNPFDKHYVDRDLLRTGLSIVIVTPGCGRFDVDKKLLRITTERMIDNGIGMDLVCLSKIPLHTVPLFKFKSKELLKIPSFELNDQKSIGNMNNGHGGYGDIIKLESRDPLNYDDDNDPNYVYQSYYKKPNWIDCSFYHRNQDKPFKPDKFVTRCRMYEIQMMGIMEHEISSILIPYLIENIDAKLTLKPKNKPLKDNIENDMYLKASSSLHPNDYTSPISKSPDLSHPRKSQNDYLISTRSSSSRGHSNELSRSLPKTLSFDHIMAPFTHLELNRQIPQFFKSKLSGISLKRDKIIRSNSQTSHDDIRTDDDDVTVVTSSTVRPISIKSPTSSSRYLQRDTHHRELSPSPTSSHHESTKSSCVSEKGKNFIKQSPGKTLPTRQIYKHNTINPSNPSKNQNKLSNFSSYLRRWEHVFPKTLSINKLKWQSICTPACLPLMTDFFPPISEIDAYDEFTYTISIDDPEIFTQDQNISEEVRTKILLKEMISQRLSQGYQLIVPSFASLSNNSNNNVNGDLTSKNLIDEIVSINIDNVTKSLNWKNTTVGNQVEENHSQLKLSNSYYLSMGRQVHKLTYDPTGPFVEVKRYVRKIHYKACPVPYSCVVWPKCQNFYENRKVMFGYPNIDYKWNYVDQLVCGYQYDLLEPLKFWRTRFILIPLENNPSINSNDNLDEEETRVQGIFKFLEMFKRSTWTSSIMTLDPSVYIKSLDDITFRRQSVHQAEEHLSKDSSLTLIAQAMLDPVNGIVKDRRWHFKTYPNAIVGNEFVNWLIKNFHDIETRENAVAFGNILQEKGLFEHCKKRHKFLDGFYYYQLKEEYTSLPTDKDAITTHPSSLLDKVKPTFEMSRSMQIDIDPYKKSDRRETAILHHDILHNPDNGYHFQLNWLGCTARLIEELLQQWGRTADKYGLKLVEAPVEQAMSLTDSNPFQSPTLIKLSVQPPKLESIGKQLHPTINPYLYFETKLIKHFKFILDVEADSRFSDEIEIIYSYHKTPYKYSQFIHKSGVAFIQICDPGEGYLWVNNRLFTTHSTTAINKNTNSTNIAPNPDTLLREFQNFCNDKEVLQKFWDDVVNKSNEFVECEEESLTSMLGGTKKFLYTVIFMILGVSTLRQIIGFIFSRSTGWAIPILFFSDSLHECNQANFVYTRPDFVEESTLNTVHPEDRFLISFLIMTAPRRGDPDFLLRTIESYLSNFPNKPEMESFYTRTQMIIYTHFTNHTMFDKARAIYSNNFKAQNYLKFHREEGLEINQRLHVSKALRLVAENFKTTYVALIEDDFPLCEDKWQEFLTVVYNANVQVPRHCGIFVGTGGRLDVPPDILLQNCLLGEIKGCEECSKTLVTSKTLLMYHLGYNTSTSPDRRYHKHEFQCGWRHPFVSVIFF